MNKETLKNYRNLNYEIYRLNKRIDKLKKTKIEHDKVVGSNTEFPYQEISISIEGLVDNSERIKNLEKILAKRIKQAVEQKMKVEEFICNIFDSRLRMIFEMRYIENKSWIYISRKLGSHEESYARKIHDRFLNKF